VLGSGSSQELVEQLLARVRELESIVADQQQMIAKQVDRIASLQRRLGQDSSTSSRPPSADAPWDKKPARKRSSRSRSGRKPGKQPGLSSVSRSWMETFVAPGHCAHCERSLAGAAETGRVRRQAVDVDIPPLPKVTEYQLVSRRCGGCGHLNNPTATDVNHPGSDGGSVLSGGWRDGPVFEAPS
jgi:transposase